MENRNIISSLYMSLCANCWKCSFFMLLHVSIQNYKIFCHFRYLYFTIHFIYTLWLGTRALFIRTTICDHTVWYPICIRGFEATVWVINTIFNFPFFPRVQVFGRIFLISRWRTYKSDFNLFQTVYNKMVYLEKCQNVLGFLTNEYFAAVKNQCQLRFTVD